MNPISILAIIGIFAGLLTAFWRRIPMVGAIALANVIVLLLTVATGIQGTILGSPLLDDLATKVDYLTLENWRLWPTVLSASFLHSGIPHLLGNLFVLVMMGMPFEERVGRVRFLAIYVFGAITAVLLHALWTLGADPASSGTYLVGASGAVFGIIGAFATAYPRDQIPMHLVVIFLPRVPVLVGAAILTGLELVMLLGFQSNVARAAHLGGVVGGSVAAFLLKPKVSLLDARPKPLETKAVDLQPLATSSKQRDILRRYEESQDQPEVQRAWLERFASSLACRECGDPLIVKGDRIACRKGHAVIA